MTRQELEFRLALDPLRPIPCKLIAKLGWYNILECPVCGTPLTWGHLHGTSHKCTRCKLRFNVYLPEFTQD